MLKILLPLIFVAVGGGAGVATGLMMKPAPHVEETEDGAETSGDEDHAALSEEDAAQPAAAPDAEPPIPGELSFEYARLKNQFVVPVIRGDLVKSVVIVSISLEVKSGSTDLVFAVEPRLRDSFLQAMFDHAAIGGFDGAFANNQNIKRLRRALKERAYAVLGDRVNDVLITDIVRQDM